MKLEIEIRDRSAGKYDLLIECPSYKIALKNITLVEARKGALDAVKDSIHFISEENREAHQKMMEDYI